MSKIQITTTRLLLEPLGMKYLETVHTYASDLENTRFMVYLPNDNKQVTIDHLTSVEEAWNSEQQTCYEFAILRNHVHIGAVSIYIDETNTGELGWIIDKRYWKQGYASEAAKALMNYANKELHVKHFIAHCDSENTGSYKVMECLGMKLKERSFGRKNKASKELREELMYECFVE